MIKKTSSIQKNTALQSEFHLLQLLGLVSFFTFVGMLYFHPPFWSLMDEPFFVAEIKNWFGIHSSWEYMIHYVKEEWTGWGMFRPVYPVFLYYFYGWFGHSSVLAYWVNFSIMILVLWGWSVLFERFIVMRAENNSLIYPRSWRYLFFVLCCLFTPHFNLFYYPTAQEKFTLLFGLLVYGALLGLGSGQSKPWLKAICLFAGLLLVLLSRASGIFMVPIVVLWILSHPLSQKNKIAFVVLASAIGLTFGYLFLSIRKSYSNRYQFTSLWDQFVSHGLRFQIPFLFGLVFAVGFFVYWLATDRERNLPRLANMLIWPISLLSYLVVMLPWRSGVDGYYFATAGVFLIATSLYCFSFLMKRMNSQFVKIRRFLFVLVFIGIGFFSFKKLNLQSLQNYGTRLVVETLKSEIASHEGQDMMIRMVPPCVEAAGHIKNYLRKSAAFGLLEKGDAFLNSSHHSRRLMVFDLYCRQVPDRVVLRRVLLAAPPWYIDEVDVV